MRRKIQTAGIVAGGLVLLIAILTVGVKAAPIKYSARETSVPAKMGGERDSRKMDFVPFQVVDDGAVLPDNQEYTGIVCNIEDTFSEEISVKLSDGKIREEEVTTMNLNNVWFSVPQGGSRCFGVPIFSTEYYAEGEREQEQEWHDVTSIDCPEFNVGMEEARKLIREGYLQEDLENFLLKLPEINPTERKYTLYLTGGGRTDRKSDDTSWWELDYILTTAAENGEVVPVITIDITKIIKAQGWESTDDAYCRIWTAESGYWRLLEDGATDLGKIWLSQLPEEDFSEEEEVRSYVEKMGGNFDLLLPSGADRQIKWECSEGKFGWYNYLIWTGTTDTYEISLAIPLMEPESGGWYLASRIRKEAAQKDMCADTLLTMMQTFHLDSSTYAVRKGDTLWEIYKRYMNEEEYSFREFSEYNGFKNPGWLYPGWRVRFPGR